MIDLSGRNSKSKVNYSCECVCASVCLHVCEQTAATAVLGTHQSHALQTNALSLRHTLVPCGSFIVRLGCYTPVVFSIQRAGWASQGAASASVPASRLLPRVPAPTSLSETGCDHRVERWNKPFLSQVMFGSVVYHSNRNPKTMTNQKYM